MKAWKGWLRARWVLGWALFWRVLLAPWARRQSDPARWLGRMTAEGLGRTPAANWPLFAATSRCIGCGRCDLFGSATLPRPSELMLGGPRLQADAPALLAQADALLAVAEQIRLVCPTGADPVATANLLRQNAGALQGAQPEKVAR